MSLKSNFFNHIVSACPCIIFTNWRDCMLSTVDDGNVETVVIIIIVNIIVCTEYFAKISKSPATTKNYKSLHHVNSKHAHHAAYSAFLRPKLTATTTRTTALHPAIWLTTGWKMKKKKKKYENRKSHCTIYVHSMNLQRRLFLCRKGNELARV